MATSIYLLGSLTRPSDFDYKPLIVTIPLDLVFGISALAAGILGATGFIAMSNIQAQCLIGLGIMIIPCALPVALLMIALIGYSLGVCYRRAIMGP